MTTAGEKLKAARLKKNLQIEDVSKSTKIKPSFLEYIEKGEYQKLPSVSYAHGFVRNYALFLGLDEKEIMAIFRREFDFDKTFKVLPKGIDIEREFQNRKHRIRSTWILIIAVFLIFFGFILFQYRNAFLNPSLAIIYPKDKSVINSSQVTVQGITDPDTTVYVDKNEVSVTANGGFSKTINVFPGVTTILIRSINKFQHETLKKIEINVRGS